MNRDVCQYFACLSISICFSDAEVPLYFVCGLSSNEKKKQDVKVKTKTSNQIFESKWNQ